ncbi:hypothetical protein CEXT_46701 [Caerostris extrusa]|uniref:Uncharacterized protein n=1 Tax=Caerostris extrusa TaxID=172846 RepID=A0AAV4MV24_CAEEX|nr:hypothetical protein CEXT_46701 [Caerostris extrusa]
MVVTFYLVTLILDQAELRANDKQSMTIKGPKLSQDARPLTPWKACLHYSRRKKYFSKNFKAIFNATTLNATHTTDVWNKENTWQKLNAEDKVWIWDSNPSTVLEGYCESEPGPGAREGAPRPFRADGLIDAGDDDDLRITPPSPRACSIQVIGDFSWETVV